MSLRVIGYDKAGRRIVVEEGPARARPQGFGGQALGSAVAATVVKPRERWFRAPLADIRRDRPICGTPLPGWRNQFSSSPIGNGVCVRTPGHRDSHRSKSAMDTDAKRRRRSA